jgi:hypothetical protein
VASRSFVVESRYDPENQRIANARKAQTSGAAAKKAAIANIWRPSMEEWAERSRVRNAALSVGWPSVASQGAREHALLDAQEGIGRAEA